VEKLKNCQKCGKDLTKKQISKRNKCCSLSCSAQIKNQHSDPNFLNHSDELKYYMIGLIWTDGCLSKQEGKSERLTIALKDKELIERLNEVVCPNRKIYINKPKKETHSPSYVIINMCEDVILYLKDKGLEPRKSRTLCYPEIEEEHFGDFLRGVFDGDGSIYKNTVNGHTYKHLSITSASKDFARGLKKQLKSFGLNPTLIRDSRGHVEYVKINRKDEIEKMKELMYGKNPQFYIDRKKTIFYEDIV
jgi:DNA-binding transcriptional regulator WhiA